MNTDLAMEEQIPCHPLPRCTPLDAEFRCQSNGPGYGNFGGLLQMLLAQ